MNSTTNLLYNIMLFAIKGSTKSGLQPWWKKIRKSMDARDKGLMVRMVIASVIEDQFSAEDRGEYMFEVFSGNAK